MILSELLDDNRLIRRWSDRGVLLHKIGTEEYYGDPVDLVDAPWEYEETEIPVEEDEVESDEA